ncbi:Fibronectin type III domain-containing protein [Micromonospora echinospora]|uniref:Fibronectin type III domain-containing protein n=2 Tax=Micromonospora echinospora TaxID=1877 RepID=A0A1C4YQQ0_MICEC|nr:Fibronectin type III domain-containing protein [Micromonospora echinospora]
MVADPPVGGYPFHPLRRSTLDGTGRPGPVSGDPAGEFFSPPPAPPAPEQLPPAYPVEKPDRDPGRRLLVVMVLAAVLVVLLVMAGVGLLVVNVMRDRTAPSPPTAAPPTPAPTFDPPGDLRLRDDSTSVTLTWTDPSGGVVPFVVAGGRAGLQLGAMASLDPGRTTWTVNGLNPRVDYCFTVLAVYSTESYATSGQVCTTREPGPSPS